MFTLRLAVLASVLVLGACGCGDPGDPPEDEEGSVEALASASDPTYLALGDSVVFGSDPNVPRYTEPNAYHSYPEQVAGAIGARLLNAACPGQTTSGFLSRTGNDLGCFRNLDAGLSLKLDWRAPTQAAYALTTLREKRNVRLVTLQLGANDLVSTMFTCGSAYTGCVEDKRYGEVPSALLEAKRNLRTILTQIRSVYDGPLVVVNYYSTDYEAVIATTAMRLLNAAIRYEAERTEIHARVADVFGDFEAASSRTGMCASGLLAKTPDCASLNPTSPNYPRDYCKAPLEDPRQTPCNTHPSAAGHARIAQAVLAALR